MSTTTLSPTPSTTEVRPQPPIHLRAAGVSLVLDVEGPQLPRVLHWGTALPDLSPADLLAVAGGLRAPRLHNALDEPQPVAVIAEASRGWFGIPGVEGHRDGVDFSPRFDLDLLEHSVGIGAAGPRPGTVVARAVDRAIGLGLELRISLTARGLLTVDTSLSNLGDTPYQLDGLRPALPLPSAALEILDFTGRHTRERAPQRHSLAQGSWTRTGRRGRTGSDSTMLLAAGLPGFGFRAGPVWAVHTAWSGNHLSFVERDKGGQITIGGGEELLPGELRLRAGESYSAPTLHASYGDGLDEVSERFHRGLRDRVHHPSDPRPVTLNTWEAVYFDHDLAKLLRLVDRAAAAGIERFVLDDGWFGGRRDATAGLGDWFVSPDAWPDGLHPLVAEVRRRGMQFGLWFEPEMINLDSDLARAHPEWVMSSGHRPAPASRDQQVLDLANPEAYAHLLERMDALIGEYSLDYLKWDHNRDLVDGGHPLTRRAGVHDQTLALYRLLDELRSRHPALEIESCSSGGGRVDLGILEHTDRIWVSDCIDPLERQTIQRWTGLMVPPELMGSHVGAATSHTTGRTHSLEFRAISAFFGHFGVEWDLDLATEPELTELTQWVALHKRFRPLLHSGTTVHADVADPTLLLSGLVAADRSEALYSLVSLASAQWSPPGPLTFPGLDPDRHYRVEPLLTTPTPFHTPPWFLDPPTLPGAALMRIGLQAPVLLPESARLLHLRSVDDPS